jgi:hypothetical protein
MNQFYPQISRITQMGEKQSVQYLPAGGIRLLSRHSKMNPNQKIVGVFQYFYHCSGEELPVRDVCDRQGHGRKTEPHYENLTENWCSKCMNGRIKSAKMQKHFGNFTELNAIQRSTPRWVKPEFCGKAAAFVMALR